MCEAIFFKSFVELFLYISVVLNTNMSVFSSENFEEQFPPFFLTLKEKTSISRPQLNVKELKICITTLFFSFKFFFWHKKIANFLVPVVKKSTFCLNLKALEVSSAFKKPISLLMATNLCKMDFFIFFIIIIFINRFVLRQDLNTPRLFIFAQLTNEIIGRKTVPFLEFSSFLEQKHKHRN
ncbi:hypothetical protein EGR_04459 [Echinococcus granulosus]|uniref:Uncharacterized protein n=1 Tax=Echinococcus granulosus TaxID=6210 RepID=W6UHT3_ECHGR|nr:hypothetical protein EGR_04459 [Echinococcus granulosus]EUB60626.1 hypothetical protein EGR_04459 [Echinococcus granulosus]